MTWNRRWVCAVAVVGCFAGVTSAPVAQPTPQNATAAPVLRIESPADGSILNTRQPTIRVCLSGADEATRATFRATLDGESISRRFRWSGDCAQWSPYQDWFGFGKRHAWSAPPYEEDGWTGALRDGGHDLEASVSPPTGAGIAAQSHFRVETRHMAVSLGVGFPNMSLEGFVGPFAPTNLLEGRFGPEDVSTIVAGQGTLTYSEKSVSIGGISTRLA